MEAIPGLILIVLYYFAVKLQIKLFDHWAKKKSNKISLYMFLTVFTFWNMFSGVIAAFMFSAKLEKNRKRIYELVAKNPNNENVDILVEELEKYGCTNTPNAWNQLRALWFTINESPNVTTDKKKQLKQFLMLQGLTMHHHDAQIIDNYKG